jgi:alkanesulfonate monooxygenase SsuD/methylene tetrahydromethanopterin reductase-like flavin-dependent oxidoreductase (luciferase family)
MPLLMAARGEQALALCGRIADGLIISNMCPAEFTQAAVAAVREAARQAQRPVPAEVVQYIPCAVRLDRAEAYGLAKVVLGDMLASFWSLGERVPAAKAALLRAQALSESDFATAVARLRAGEQPVDALDDRFVEAFAIAGTADDALAQARRYANAGASELVLTFAGRRPEPDMQHLANAARGIG